MSGYSPLKITGMQTGLVQSREEFILPNDAYPVLQNAFVWRERIKRKQGTQFLGRLRRVQTSLSLGNFDGGGNFTGNLITIFSLETNASFEEGSIVVVTIANTFTDINPITMAPPNGNIFNPLGVVKGTINYATGDITITSGPSAGQAATISFNYFPNLPVMGLRTQEQDALNNETTIAFDQTYSYIFDFVANAWKEFIPGTTWNGSDSEFFWSTNYYVGDQNKKIFWVTNFNIDQATHDPIRYTNTSGTAWIDFNPIISNGDPTQKLFQCLALLPFRSRLVVFNTFEGTALNSGIQNFQRVRWSAIGNPFSDVSALVSQTNSQAWFDDIRGQGGFLDIPTSEAIVSVGFVRDNLVIYCERSTWQLRYTGRSIAPFQVEKVNSELGCESTFSAIQFDTSLVGIGDKGIVQCDSYKSDRIDIKIPDLIFEFNNNDQGPKRVQGIRDFQQRLAYWTYPYAPNDQQSDTVNVRNKFPDKRLVYNYENDSWAIFDDSFTALGNFQAQSALIWANLNQSNDKWKNQNYPWITRQALFSSIIGGNQQGYVSYLDQQVTNEVSLFANDIVGNSPAVTVVTSINHNLLTGAVIQLIIDTGFNGPTPYLENPNQIYGIVRLTKDTFELWVYESSTGQFSKSQVDTTINYIGGVQIIVLDNFSIQSKKFNFIDEGQNIQIGFIDVLMDNTSSGGVTMNIYADYNETQPLNTFPQNVIQATQLPDTFFNSTVPTSVSPYRGSSKNWQRVYCPTRAAFLTIEWTLSNAQMVGDEQGEDVQIDAQILWVRKAGRQLPIGV